MRWVALGGLVAIGLAYAPIVVVALALGYLALNPHWRT